METERVKHRDRESEIKHRDRQREEHRDQKGARDIKTKRWGENHSDREIERKALRQEERTQKQRYKKS